MNRSVLASSVLLLFGLSGLSAVPANASNEAERTSASAGIPSAFDETSRPFALYGGIGSGYGIVSGSDYAQAPGGMHVLLGAAASLQIRRWELDGGLSWLYSDVNGRTAGNLPVSVRTRAGTLDLGARYRLGSHWQVGPAFNFAFGTDTSFGPSVGDSQGELLVGLKALYELPKMPIPIRLWTQLSTDTSIDNRRLYVGLAGVQLGIPVSIPRRSPAAERPEDAIRISSAAPERQVKVVLDSRKIFFGTMSYALRPEVAAALKDVGHYLGDSPDATGGITIAGHADQRGRFKYNLKLSRKRAEAVSAALSEGGADPEQLKTEAFSYLMPLDAANNPGAWAKNRRVEITFENVREPELLRKRLEALEAESH